MISIGKLIKKALLVSYLGMWSVVIIGATTWLGMFLIGTLGDPFDKQATDALGSDAFDAVVALTEKKVARHLGEWEFSEPKIPGHFHHIGRWYESDKFNFCIKCHGPTPHSRSPKERAFLNMHGLFISCQVCHVHEEEGVAPSRFGWIDIADGKLNGNPEMAEGVWGEYGSKIVAVNGPKDKPQAIVLEEEEVIADELRKRMGTVSDQQKVIVNKRIHRRCVETPVRCSQCHNSEKPFLPYTALGYTAQRAAFLVSSEVADLAAHYETFYLPNLLNAEGQAPDEARGDGK
ncbi:MAG: hypothetical protein ACYS8Z_09655 [Planctomycetota bacterium]|jgi:hypothetical protein